MQTTAQQNDAQIAFFGFTLDTEGRVTGCRENLTALRANRHSMTAEAIVAVAGMAFECASLEAHEIDRDIAVGAEDDRAADNAHARASAFFGIEQVASNRLHRR